jgi:hypothetical protein
MGLTTSPPFVSQLPRKCGILDVSQPYGPSWPVTGMVYLFKLTEEGPCVFIEISGMVILVPTEC